MSDDLEAIPLERSGPPPAASVPEPPPSPQGRWPARLVAIIGLGAAALLGGWLSSGGSDPSVGSGRIAGEEPASAGGEIVCPSGQVLAGTDLGRLGPPREAPDAAVSDVAKAFRGHPAAEYRYRPDEKGGDWVYFLGTADAVPKVRISVRHLEEGWIAVAISGCDGAYPAGLVDYPAERPVPPLSSTTDLVLAINDPLQRRGPVATLALHDASGHTVWELPRIGAWYPTPVSWSPDGRRFLFRVAAGEQTGTRVVILPEGRDVAVPGALTWIGDDAMLVVRDGRLGRLDLASPAVVAGPPLTQPVTSLAGTRGRAAMVIVPDRAPPVVRIVDSELNTQDTAAPPGIVDCFSASWTADGMRLALVCRRSDAPVGSADTDIYEIDMATLRWTRMQVATEGSVEQPLRSPAAA